MQWTSVRRGKDIVALRSGEYEVLKEMIFGDMHYFATHGAQLLTVACDADTAKRACEADVSGPSRAVPLVGGR